MISFSFLEICRASLAPDGTCAKSEALAVATGFYVRGNEANLAAATELVG
jgi:hypothetical protein